MKSRSYTMNIDESLLALISKPVRKHQDCIDVILNTMKFWNLFSSKKIDSLSAKLIISVGKMSRLFIIRENRVESILFPFTVVESESGVRFISKSIGDITNFHISRASSIINNQSYNSGCIYEFSDSVIDSADVLPNFWGFIRELMDFEGGYVRYDTDAKNENGDLHPLHHLDIFFSSSATFKVGKDNVACYDDLIDVLDVSSGCWYLHKSD